MLTDITLSKEESEGTEIVVATWFKAIGDRVTKNEPLLEISTDKVSVEIAAPETGVLREILKKDGDSVEPGDVLGRIEAGATAALDPQAKAPRSPVSPAASAPALGTAGLAAELSPAVRRALKQHGLDPGQVKGSGRGGRITVEDVEAFVLGRQASSPAPARAPATGERRSRRVPHSAMRRSIAQHMSESMRIAPHATSVFEVDLTTVIAHRETHKADFAARGVGLTFTAYFVRASVEALRTVPEANARFHEDHLEIFEEHNIGIATALDDGGLIVPVLRNAEALDLFQTAERLGDLTSRARSGKLEPKDVQGGTFTISNHGVSGSLLAAPIVIPQPQSAILGVGKLEQRVVVTKSGSFEARPKAYVTLSIDHRVLDGAHANAFLTKWVAVLESFG